MTNSLLDIDSPKSMYFWQLAILNYGTRQISQKRPCILGKTQIPELWKKTDNTIDNHMCKKKDYKIPLLSKIDILIDDILKKLPQKTRIRLRLSKKFKKKY